MFNGRRKNKRQGESSSNVRHEAAEEIDLNDVKVESIRSRRMSTDMRKSDMLDDTYIEDVNSVYSRGQSGSIGDVIDDKPKLQRALKARHVTKSLTAMEKKFLNLV